MRGGTMRRMQADPGSAAEQMAAVRRASWIAFGFGVWLIGGFFLVLWAIAQGQSPDVAASPFHIPVYAGLIAIAIFSAVRVVRALRRGASWRDALSGHPATLVGAAVLVGGLLLDVGWREGIGIAGEGIEASLAPSRVVLAIGFFMVAAAPLLAARRHGAGAIPLAAGIGSAGLILALLSWPGGFHPAGQAWLAEDEAPIGQASELWVMNGDGSHQTRLIEAAEGENFGYASWIGDGTRISYTRFVLDGEHLEMGQASIWSAAADGTDHHADLRGQDWNWIPRWSPDGTWLAFTREAPGGPWMEGGPAGPAPGGAPAGGAQGPLSVPLPQADIWRVAGSGGEPQRLTTSAGDDRAPVYSPDGSQI
ncbi:MAG TPA: hypothetical protein VF153_05250, partial [Candidatus Limnocylindria bacterium]